MVKKGEGRGAGAPLTPLLRRPWKIDLIKSGYEDNVLESVQFKAFERVASPKAKSTMENNTIIFTVDYFEDLKTLKDVVLNIERDVKAVFGNINIKVATRKNSSIGNSVVKNKSLCTKESINLENQKCGDKRCMICPFMIATDSVIINDRELSIPKNLNCKSKECIYLCICNKCNKNNAYFGQTVQ